MVPFFIETLNLSNKALMLLSGFFHIVDAKLPVRCDLNDVKLIEDFNHDIRRIDFMPANASKVCT